MISLGLRLISCYNASLPLALARTSIHPSIHPSRTHSSFKGVIVQGRRRSRASFLNGSVVAGHFKEVGAAVIPMGSPLQGAVIVEVVVPWVRCLVGGCHLRGSSSQQQMTIAIGIDWIEYCSPAKRNCSIVRL
jgi:hypothetical protein